MRAYMFINALRGQSLTLTKTIRDVPGVHAADAITGAYDHYLHGAHRLKESRHIVSERLDKR